MIVGSTQKYFNESLRFNGADRAVIKRLASESVMALWIERINSKKLSGRQ